MIAALAPLFFGEFASYRDVLTTFEDPRPSLPVRQLLHTAQLDAVLQRFDPLHVGQDRRALASQWSKHYLVRLIPPVVAAALVLGRRLPLALDAIEVVLDEQGLPQAFKLPDDGEPFAVPPADRASASVYPDTGDGGKAVTQGALEQRRQLPGVVRR